MSDVNKTLEERGGRYGAFINHATIAQGLQEVLFDAPNWPLLDPDMRQAMCVICDKMARIINGDPYYEDNWHDIQGYAQLVEKRVLALKEKSLEVFKTGRALTSEERAEFENALKDKCRGKSFGEKYTG